MFQYHQCHLISYHFLLLLRLLLLLLHLLLLLLHPLLLSIGYHIKLECKKSAKTRMLLMTTGVLLRRLQVALSTPLLYPLFCYTQLYSITFCFASLPLYVILLHLIYVITVLLLLCYFFWPYCFLFYFCYIYHYLRYVFFF